MLDQNGYLNWNTSFQICNENIRNFCVAGSCQYVSPQCYSDNDCTSSQVCDLHTNKCVTSSSESNNEIFSISSIPLGWRYGIMIILAFLGLLVPMIFAGREGVLAGLAFSAVIVIGLTIVFYLNVLIPIVYTVIAGGIFAILIRKVSTG